MGVAPLSSLWWRGEMRLRSRTLWWRSWDVMRWMFARLNVMWCVIDRSRLLIQICVTAFLSHLRVPGARSVVYRKEEYSMLLEILSPASWLATMAFVKFKNRHFCYLTILLDWMVMAYFLRRKRPCIQVQRCITADQEVEPRREHHWPQPKMPWCRPERMRQGDCKPLTRVSQVVGTGSCSAPAFGLGWYKGGWEGLW